MNRERKLTTSQLDYLDAIFSIVSKKQAARARDIGERLEVAGSSVTGALKNLRKKGLINYAPYDLITLTPEGEKIAKEVILYRDILKKFLTLVLNLSDNEAEETAGRLKSQVDKKLMERIIHYLRFLSVNTEFRLEWKDSGFCKTEGATEETL